MIVPAAGWGWLDGVPLGVLEAAALALVWWTWAGNRHLPAARWVAALALVKLAFGAALVERGFVARYYANDAWTAPVQRSIEFRRAPFTRIDRRLAFGSGSAPGLPLHFFNNVEWNYYRPTEPRREQMAYSAEWTGYLHADTAEAITVYVDGGPGVVTELALDGETVIPLDASAHRARSLTLDEGWHPLIIRAKGPYGASRAIEAGEIVSGTRRPFDDRRVFVGPVGTGRGAVDAALRWTTRALDAAWLAWLGALVLLGARRALRDRRGVPLLWLGAIAEAFWYASRYVGRLTVLSGGNDWLMYEHLGRVIALGDPLLEQRGPGGGQGTAFYFQPLYPYFVAGAHLGFGDGLFGVVLLQRLLLVATIAWASAITTRLFGPGTRWMALIGGGAFLYARGSRWTEVLLSEPVFMPLLVGWTALLVRMCTGPATRAGVAAAGVLGGLATLMRPTLLAAWPPMLVVWGASLRAHRARAVAGLALTMLVVASLAGVRNWIVVGTFIFSPTSFGPSLALGNPPPQPLNAPPPERVALYDRLRLDPNTQHVVEFVIQDPREFGYGLVNKTLYAIGFFGRSGLPGGIGTSWLYVGIWLLTAVAVVRIIRAPARPNLAVWLPLIGALSHLAPLILVFPHGYRDRLVLPLYPLLIPYAAYALEPLPPVLTRAVARLWRVIGGGARSMRVHVMPVVAPVLRQPRNWVYIAYTAAAFWSANLLATLLLPATVLAVAFATRPPMAHRVITGSLWAAALVRIAAVGSLSADAIHDPLFWGVVALIALVASGVTGRWPVISAATSALAGACTIIGVVLPFFPGFDESLPDLGPATIAGSVAVLSEQLGPFATVCLFGVWLQAMVTPRVLGSGRLAPAVRGALLAALMLSLAGVVHRAGIDARVWLAGVGVLLGLAEGETRIRRAPSRSAAPGATQSAPRPTDPTPADTAGGGRTR